MLASLRRCCSRALHFGGLCSFLCLLALAPAHAGEARVGTSAPAAAQQADIPPTATPKATGTARKTASSPTVSEKKKASASPQQGHPQKKATKKNAQPVAPQGTNSHQVPKGPVRNGTSRLMNGTTPANATFKDGWVIMEPGSRPAYVGIHGGTAPVSLHSANGTLFAFTGLTGNDFIHVLQGNAPNPGSAQQKINNSTGTPPANATGEHSPTPTEKHNQGSAPATDHASEKNIPLKNATAAPASAEPPKAAASDLSSNSHVSARTAESSKNETSGSRTTAPAGTPLQGKDAPAQNSSLPGTNGTLPEQRTPQAQTANGTAAPAAKAPSLPQAAGNTPQHTAAAQQNATHTAPANSTAEEKNTSAPAPLSQEEAQRAQVASAPAAAKNEVQRSASGEKSPTPVPPVTETKKTETPHTAAGTTAKAPVPLEPTPAGKLAPLPPIGTPLPATAKEPITPPAPPLAPGTPGIEQPPLPLAPASPAEKMPTPASVQPTAPPVPTKATQPPAPAPVKKTPAPAQVPAPAKGASPVLGTSATPVPPASAPAAGQTQPAGTAKPSGTAPPQSTKEQHPSELVFATGDQASRISSSTEEMLPFGLQSPKGQSEEEALSLAAAQQAKALNAMPPLKLRGYSAVLSHQGPL